MNLKRITYKPLIATAAILTGTAGLANAAISILDTSISGSTSNTFSGTIDATGATKLVAMISGENGFSGAPDATILTTEITGGGASFTQLVNRAPVASGDINVNDIWYLDLTGTGTVTVDVTMNANTRGIISLFALSGTAAGAGATAISSSGSQSVDLTTTAANSLVLVGYGAGGNGNTAAHTDSLTGVGSLTKETNFRTSNWNGLVTGSQLVGTAGANTFAFSGGSATDIAGANVVAAEFLAIPEPSTFGLIGLAGFALLARRRRS